MTKFLPFILLLSLGPLTAAQRVASKSGNWAEARTWGNTGIPVEDDTITVKNKVTVTVSDRRSAGASGPSGSTAIQLNDSGALIIAGGGFLQVRGDVVYAAGLENTAPAVTVRGGGTWEFDSSQAGGSVSYTFGPNGDLGFRAFIAVGAAGARATVGSNPKGGNGRFSLNKHNYGGSIQATYTDFYRIGDAANPGWTVWWYGLTGAHEVRWDVQDSTFTECGRIQTDGFHEPEGHFIHRNNVHASTVAKDGILNFLALGPVGRGSRMMIGNVFDIQLATLIPTGMTISHNYFGKGLAISVQRGQKWAVFEDNFVRLPGGSQSLGGDVANTYVFFDVDQTNPHVLMPTPHFVCNLNGVIWGHGGTARPPGGADSGELFFGTNPVTPSEYSLTNSIMLPNAAGYSSLEIGAWGFFPNMFARVEHNTWFGGFDGTPGGIGFAAIQVGEGFVPATNQIHSFRSNILFNPQLNGYTAAFFKLHDIGNRGAGATPATDICLPASCDHNTGWNHSLTNPGARAYSNQGRGYAAKFSSPPGKHDVDVNPMFVDWQRTVELFDSKYLRNTPAKWSGKTQYKTGDMVQHSRPNIYWNLGVNYRYTNAGACQGRNPEPGEGANWRACWEWASLYRLREGLKTHQLFNDEAIGVNGEDILKTMMKWIRAGYAPTNPALKNAAHDGADIGAVPVRK